MRAPNPRTAAGDLFRPEALATVLHRLEEITPASERRWGRMSAHQMVCHLSDVFGGAIGERPVAGSATLYQRTLVRWFALHAPLLWPRGVRTLPAVDAEAGGSPPGDFDRDLAELRRRIEAFAGSARELDGRSHPMFGRLSAAEWGRWGYRHVDHHLRQFGA